MMEHSREENLLRALGEIDDDLILAAGEQPPKVLTFPAARPWRKAAIAAACFLICAGVWMVGSDFLYMGKSAAGAPEMAMPPSNFSNPMTEGAAETVEDCAPAETPEASPMAPEYAVAEVEEESVVEESIEEEAVVEDPILPEPEIELPVEATADPVNPSREEQKAEQPALDNVIQVLQISGERDALAVERKVTIDASCRSALVNDQYLLRNSGTEALNIDTAYDAEGLVFSQLPSVSEEDDSGLLPIRQSLTLDPGETVEMIFLTANVPLLNEENGNVELQLLAAEKPIRTHVTVNLAGESHSYEFSGEEDSTLSICSGTPMKAKE